MQSDLERRLHEAEEHLYGVEHSKPGEVALLLAVRALSQEVSAIRVDLAEAYEEISSLRQAVHQAVNPSES